MIAIFHLLKSLKNDPAYKRDFWDKNFYVSKIGYSKQIRIPILEAIEKLYFKKRKL